MKKLAFLLVLFTSFTFAQNFTGLKIMLNPGHGGHDSDDRFIATTGFWESEGNLTKGLYLRDILQGYGAQIVMSRVTNFTSDDLPLSQICQIANNNNVDYFQSIHSNAFDGKTNYPLTLFRGTDAAPVFPAAKQMAIIEYNHLKTELRHPWTGGVNARGDFSFYGNTSGLGVLRTLNMPGVLSEGSFHDYIPESWRLQNLDYRYLEARSLARTFIEYWQKNPDPNGTIAGIVRDPLKPFPYFAIASSNDGKHPLDSITVRLEPSGKVYTGDKMKNGFFFFDSVAPGSYKVIISAYQYMTDTVNVTVIANKTSFADLSARFDVNLAPQVITQYPSATTNVSAVAPIGFDFSLPMNKESVVNAITITPPVYGSFQWSNQDMSVRFVPSIPYEKNTTYTVELAPTAQSQYNVPTGVAKTFQFTTQNRNRFKLLTSYPSDNQHFISPWVQFNFTFDGDLDKASLSGNMYLINPAGNIIAFKNPVTSFENGIGKLTAEPGVTLDPNTHYRIELKGGIKDKDGIPFVDPVYIHFRTDHTIVTSGTIIEDFEATGTWQDPDLSPLTTGTNPTTTSFGTTTTQKVSGTKSGKMNYEFTGTAGVAAVTNTTPPSVGSGRTGMFGAWVYGDLSNNIVEYHFGYDQSGTAIVVVDTLNWTGWKIKTVPLSQVPGTGEIKLLGLVVKQTPAGSKKGFIFFDAVQYDVTTDAEEVNGIVPDEFSLMQNYPNPFNPTTKIGFTVKEESSVSIDIFNLTGEKVASLGMKKYNPGAYTVDFNAEHLSSGMYIYRITATGAKETFSAQKKMMLLR